jgi:hypothetical protein
VGTTATFFGKVQNMIKVNIEFSGFHQRLGVEQVGR